MLNKKGFTLIELLAVILLLGLIMGIGSPTIVTLINNIRSKSEEVSFQNIKSSGNLYTKEYIEDIRWVDESDNEYTCVSINELIEKGYIKKKTVEGIDFSNGDYANYTVKVTRDKNNLSVLKEEIVERSTCNTELDLTIDSVNTTPTTITIISTCKKNETYLDNIEYKLDNGEYSSGTKNGNSNNKEFSGLNKNKKYKYTVKCSDGTDIIEKTGSAFTANFGLINIVIDREKECTKEKNITLSNNGSDKPIYYKIGKNDTWNDKDCIFKDNNYECNLKITKNTTIYASHDNGKSNVVTRTITNIDNGNIMLKYNGVTAITKNSATINYVSNISSTCASNNYTYICKYKKETDSSYTEQNASYNKCSLTGLSSGTKYTYEISVKRGSNEVAKIEGDIRTLIVLTANANGGTIPKTSGWELASDSKSATKTVTYEKDYGALPTPTRTGYTFDGWYTKASDGTKVDSDTKVTTESNHTLYARWSANTYTISLDNQNATKSGTKELYEVYGKGVYTDSDKTKSMTSTTNSITKPERKYTITYNYNNATGGNGTKESTATYTFGGYYTSKNGEGTQRISKNGYIVTSNFKNTTYSAPGTLYAKWTEGSVTLPTPTRTGYKFDGWYKDSALKNIAGVGGASYTATANVTLYAKWTKTIPVITKIENASGGNWTNKKVTAYIYISDTSKIEKLEHSYDKKTWYSTGKTLEKVENNVYKYSCFWTGSINSTVYFRATNSYGGVSEIKTTTVKIDKTAPTILTTMTIADTGDNTNIKDCTANTCTDNTWHNKKVRLWFLATDNDSGLIYKSTLGWNNVGLTELDKDGIIDSEDETIGSDGRWNREISSDGYRYIKVTVKDKAGNKTEKDIYFKIDTTLPAVSYSGKSGNNLIFNCSPGISGMNKFNSSDTNGNSYSQTGPDINYYWNSYGSVTVTCINNAGSSRTGTYTRSSTTSYSTKTGCCYNTKTTTGVNGFSTTNVCSSIGKVCGGSQSHYTNCTYHMKDGKRAITYREWYDCSTTVPRTTAYEQFVLN